MPPYANPDRLENNLCIDPEERVEPFQEIIEPNWNWNWDWNDHNVWDFTIPRWNVGETWGQHFQIETITFNDLGYLRRIYRKRKSKKKEDEKDGVNENIVKYFYVPFRRFKYCKHKLSKNFRPTAPICLTRHRTQNKDRYHYQRKIKN